MSSFKPWIEASPKNDGAVRANARRLGPGAIMTRYLEEKDLERALAEMLARA